MENSNKKNIFSEIIQTKTGYSIKNTKLVEEDKYSLNTKEEKELQINFKYFNIFWFDPNKTHDFDYFKKSFENIKFFKGTDIETVVGFFNKESSLEEWIVISPGSKCEELISKLNDKEIINSFFIFCFKPELYQELPKKFPKIKYITKDPFILAKKIIEINKDYYIPNFIYKEEPKIKYELYLDLSNLESKNKYSLQSVLREKNELYETIRKDENKYNIFCLKTIKYLKSENALLDFEETIKDENAVFYKYVDNIKFKDKERLKKIINFVKNMTLISLYFSSYKYLYNLLSYKDIQNLLDEEITPKNYIELYNKSVYQISETLFNKIMNQESILQEKESLKNLQIFCILFTYFGLARHRSKEFLEFYQIINFYRDLDFSLKLFIFYVYLIFNDKKNKFMNDLNSALSLSDVRIKKIFLCYTNSCLKNQKLTLNENDQKILDDSLTIKNFIVVGDNDFNNKISSIEQKIKINFIKYLKIDQIINSIKSRNINDSHNNKIERRVSFDYYLIINIDDFNKYFNEICLIEAELGISFFVIVFIENENNTLLNKTMLQMGYLPIIVVYSTEDIIKYLSKKLSFYLLDNCRELIENDQDFIDFQKLNIPKINFKENNDNDYKDGCFELGETFDINLLRNKIVRKYSDNVIDYTAIVYNLYLTYSEKNALDIFFKYCSSYYGFFIDPECIYLEICLIKRIIYMYCREEPESKKSLYYMLNYDLRTRNPAKIHRYLDIIALINKLIENNELAHYEGKVYRATKLDEKMIVKLVPGSTMVNTTFWSTSKDYNIANGFLENQEWRNAFIYCDTIKNNVDIDYEHLNYFGEREVLFLPFTQFRVDKVNVEKKIIEKYLL